MGNTPNTYGKPVYAQTPTQTVADLQAAADYADTFANVRIGTTAARSALTTGQLRDGSAFIENDTGLVYTYDTTGPTWSIVAGVEEIGTYTHGALYQNHANYDNMRLSRVGKKVRLRGTITINTTVSFASGTVYTLGNVPSGWRPAASSQPFRPLGVSPAMAGWILLTSAGDLQMGVSAALSGGANTITFGVDFEYTIP